MAEERAAVDGAEFAERGRLVGPNDRESRQPPMAPGWEDPGGRHRSRAVLGDRHAADVERRADAIARAAW